MSLGGSDTLRTEERVEVEEWGIWAWNKDKKEHRKRKGCVCVCAHSELRCRGDIKIEEWARHGLESTIRRHTWGHCSHNWGQLAQEA